MQYSFCGVVVVVYCLTNVARFVFVFILWTVALTQPVLATHLCEQELSSLASREAVITGVEGIAIPISYVFKGQIIHDTARMQKEYERRFNLGQFPLRVEDTRNDIEHVLRTPEDAAAFILNITFGRRLAPRLTKTAGIYPAPLASTSAHFHSKPAEGEAPSVGKPEQFTKILKSEFKANYQYMSWDTIVANYVVGHQFERSTYWDTPGRDLEKMGLAVRRKVWFPVNEYGKLGASSASSVFLKRSSGQLVGPSKRPLTERDEYHYRLPQEMSDAEVLGVLRALLKSYGLKDADSLPLVPVVNIENTRLGIDLNNYDQAGNESKIGYIVFDSFNGQNLITGAKIPATSQVEVEILPSELEPLMTKHETELYHALFGIEDALHGKNTETPKYLQILGK